MKRNKLTFSLAINLGLILLLSISFAQADTVINRTTPSTSSYLTSEPDAGGSSGSGNPGGIIPITTPAAPPAYNNSSGYYDNSSAYYDNFSGDLVTTDLTSELTAQALAQSLVGSGVTISNVTYTGANVAAGTFSEGDGIIGFNDGVILSTGNIANVIGPNSTSSKSTSNGTDGDADLNNLSGKTTYDASILEFDFIPVDTQVTLKYVFSSEEYNEYVGSSFNDVFAILVNGLNYARVNGSQVGINTINSINNSNLYIDNSSGALNTQMDGLTKVLSIEAPVNPGQTNHLKLVIADASDRIYDSNVFIQAGSFPSSYNNSSGSYDNSSGNYDNSSGNYNNSSGNYDNSSGNYDNSSGNYDNFVGDLVTTDLTTSGLTAQNLAQSLVGSGIQISNITYTGANIAAGNFSGGNGVIGFNGVILSTGNIANVIGPNTVSNKGTSNGTAGDSDLNTLSGKTTYDASILEFDFVPSDTTLYLNYVFSSEEYNEYVGSSFNDVFAILVNGVNSAKVNGLPVGINTINNGYGATLATNPEFYIDNTAGSLNTEMDGLTKVLNIEAPVNPGVTNHMKLAIADASDSIYDSNVFIQAGSLKSEPPSGSEPPNGLAKDVYEPDNYLATAKQVTTNGVKQSHTLFPTADVDWLKFDAVGGSTYSVEASKLINPNNYNYFTYFNLYDVFGIPLPENKNRIGDGQSSKIVFTSATFSTYYIKVEYFYSDDTAGVGNYDISVTTPQASGGGNVTNPSPNNQSQAAINKQIKTLNKKIAKLKKQIKNLKKKLKNANAKQKKALIKKIKKLNQLINSAKKKVAKLKKEIESLLPPKIKALNKQIKSLKKKIVNLNKKIKSLKKKLKKANAKQKQAIKKKIAKLNKQLKASKKKITSLKKKLKKLK